MIQYVCDNTAGPKNTQHLSTSMSGWDSVHVICSHTSLLWEGELGDKLGRNLWHAPAKSPALTIRNIRGPPASRLICGD